LAAFSAGGALLSSALAALTSALATLTSLAASLTSFLASLISAAASATGTGAPATFFVTTLFLVTGTLIYSTFSSPVAASLVLTVFNSSSTTGTTSWVEFWATGVAIGFA